jgi:N6-L-threonylcarbamoyladenine synthase
VIVLGVETSCDETAAALVREDGTVLAQAVSSQIELHAPYGGVVPELASRSHMTSIVPVLQCIGAVTGRALETVEAVAVTRGPGLAGALLVGIQAAKAIAWARGLPLVGVNHLVGHLLSIHLRGEGLEVAERPDFPYVALLASGGHTALYEVRSALDVEQLGQTRDDAAGEAFDKVAKLLGLPYPGGPVIDRLAARGNPLAIDFPRPMAWRGSLDFSFSGLKTAVARHLARQGRPDSERDLQDLCASFRHAVVEVLVRKCLEACRARRVERLVLTGGVAANQGLRGRATEACDAAGVRLFLPPLAACTDNAAMIAYAGACRLLAGEQDDMTLNLFSRSPILGAAEGSPALRRYRSSRRIPKA